MQLLLYLRNPHVDKWKGTVNDHIATLNNLKNDEVPPSAPIEADMLLSLYEVVAISVMNGTVDENMIRESQRYIFQQTYRGLLAHIQIQQKNDSSLFVHFVHYAKIWTSTTSEFEASYIEADMDFIN